MVQAGRRRSGWPAPDARLLLQQNQLACAIGVAITLLIGRPRGEGNPGTFFPGDAKTEQVAIEPERPLEIAHPKPNAADVSVGWQLRLVAGP